MAIIYEKAVAEDLNLGHGTVSVTNPSGGTAKGNKIGIHTLLGPYRLYSENFDGADIGARINAAIAALPAGEGGEIYLPGGSHSFSTTIQLPITSGRTAVILTGFDMGNTGNGTTRLLYTGTGKAIDQTITDVAVQNSPGALLRHFHLDGSGAGASAIGVQFGGSLFFRLENVSIDRFDGANGIGVQVYNAAGMFTERYIFRNLNLRNNKENIVFSKAGTGSNSQLHGTMWPVYFRADSGQIGLSVKNGVHVSGTLLAEGNFLTGSTFIKVDATSQVTAPGWRIYVLAEATDGASTMTRFNLAAGGILELLGDINTLSGQTDTLSGTFTFTGLGLIANDYNYFGNIRVRDGKAIQFTGSAANSAVKAYLEEIVGTSDIRGSAAAWTFNDIAGIRLGKFAPAGMEIGNGAGVVATIDLSLMSTSRTFKKPDYAGTYSMMRAFNISGTDRNDVHIVTGAATMVAGSVTVTLTGSAIFSGNDYFVATTNRSNANAIKTTKTSGSSITFDGTGTDIVDYIMIGK